MKTAYVQTKEGCPVNSDVLKALEGFEHLGFNTVGFTLEEVVSGKLDVKAERSPFVGSILGMSVLLKSIGKYPEPVDFPESILRSGLLCRDVSKMKLYEFCESIGRAGKPMFIKPVKTKLFHGRLVSKLEHLRDIASEDCEVLVSDPIDIVSEHRVFVHNKKMVYSCNYSGDFRSNPDLSYVGNLVDIYKEQPVAYTIDVAVLKNGKTTVVEFNDFWAIGSYGLHCIEYAQMLLDRYQEITSLG